MDLSLHMLRGERTKPLTPAALLQSRATPPEMLRDVNKRLVMSGRNCVSPINVQDSTNLKIQKFISLEETGFADMYQPFHQAGSETQIIFQI